VQNLPFDADAADMDMPAPAWTSKVEKTVSDYSSLLRPLSMLGMFILIYLFVLRPFQKQVLKPGPAPAPSEPLLPSGQVNALPRPQPEINEGAARAAQLKSETAELIRQKPAYTARAVQAWLREEPS